MARQNVIHTSIERLYGGAPVDDVTARNQGAAEPRNATVVEVLTAGTVYRRPARGPKKGGRYSLQVFIDVAGGAGSAGTVWYSNHPDPDLASDADWFQDATIGTIDLTVGGNKMFFVANTFPEWIMVKMAPLVTPASVRAFIRTEGTSVSGL